MRNDRGKPWRMRRCLRNCNYAYSLPFERFTEHFSRRISLFEPTDAIKATFGLVIILCINILEAFSYGILIFPPALLVALSPTLSPLDGIYMFIQSTACSQVIYAIFSSFSGGVVGGMMVENIPFMSAISLHILGHASQREQVVPTVLMAYSISTLLIAVSLYGIWLMKLDRYFKMLPQFFLDGLLSGIGVFLLVIAGKIIIHPIEGLQSAAFSPTNLQLIVAFAMGMIIFAIQFQFPSHSFNIPLATLGFIGVFYLVAFGFLRLSWEELSTSGWLFRFGEDDGGDSRTKGGKIGYFHYFSLFHWNRIHWKCIWELIPIFFAATVFGVLHLPINIPAFAWSTLQMESFSFGREVICHSLSNFICVFLSFLPNYLVYTTSGLFWRIGGNSKLASFLLALFTWTIPSYGTNLMRGVPKVVLTSLMIYLGFDLVWYAGVLPAKNSKSSLERAAILLTCLVSNWFGFEFGLLAGSVLSLWIVAFRSFQNAKINNLGFSPMCSSGKIRYSPRLSLIIDAEKREKSTFIEVVGNLFWANSEKIVKEVESSLLRMEFVILDLRNASLYDDSFVKAMETCINLNSSCQIVICLAKNTNEKLLEFGLKFFWRIEECIEYWETCILAKIPEEAFILQSQSIQGLMTHLCQENPQLELKPTILPIFSQFEVPNHHFCLVIEGCLWQISQEIKWESGSLLQTKQNSTKFVVIKEPRASFLIFPVSLANRLPSEYW